MRGKSLLPRRGARLVLRAAARVAESGEDVGRAAAGLEALRLRGRARLCRDVAMRCLEQAGRHERLEGRLRREAGRWVREAIEELD